MIEVKKIPLNGSIEVSSDDKNQTMILPRSPLKSNTLIQKMNPVYRQPISSQEPCIIITGLNDNTFSGIINKKVTLAFDYFKGLQKIN